VLRERDKPGSQSVKPIFRRKQGIKNPGGNWGRRFWGEKGGKRDVPLQEKIFAPRDQVSWIGKRVKEQAG